MLRAASFNLRLATLPHRHPAMQPESNGSRILFFPIGAWPSLLSGGAEEIRTPDPLRAKEVLSQLSYGPGLVVGD